jgi:hypothetical protein
MDFSHLSTADLARLEDCKQELHSILQEERLFGATLLVLANKQDLPSALKPEELEQVCKRGELAVVHMFRVGQGHTCRHDLVYIYGACTFFLHKNYELYNACTVLTYLTQI